MTRFITRSPLLDDFFKDMPGFFVRPLHGDPLPDQIRMDIKEQNGAYVVQAEIPGVAKNNIHVSIDGNQVSINAEVKQEDIQKEGEQVLRSERFYGAMARTFTLPSDIDEAASKAKYEDGLLTLTLARKNRGGQQRLSIE
jgi:HSP20 family protein